MAISPVPYSPRALTRAERRSEDLYRFHSPKCGRIVEVTSCMAAAWALRCEFDSACTIYVERPRTLTLPDETVELSFWTRDRSGVEQTWLLVPNDTTVLAPDKRREHRHVRALMTAAQNASLVLNFVTEPDVHAQSARIGIAFQLLPLVQSARRLVHRVSLREAVLAAFSHVNRTTLPQLQQATAPFHTADVRAMVADLIHAGEIELPPNASLRPDLVLTKAVRHER